MISSDRSRVALPRRLTRWIVRYIHAKGEIFDFGGLLLPLSECVGPSFTHATRFCSLQAASYTHNGETEMSGEGSENVYIFGKAKIDIPACATTGKAVGRPVGVFVRDNIVLEGPVTFRLSPS